MEIFLIWIVIAIACAIVASSKGRSGFGWFILGFFLSVIALIIVAVLPSKVPPPTIAGGEVATPQTHVRCPDCKELVRKDAVKCKHCGSALVPQQ